MKTSINKEIEDNEVKDKKLRVEEHALDLEY